MEFDIENTALFFKAIGDENRIKILLLLKSGEKCACRLLEELNISQPTLSHHMKILCDCGIVKRRKEGKWSHYSICKDSIKFAQNILSELYAQTSQKTCKSCD